MFNYCVFIIVWAGSVLISAAWSLAMVLNKAFREPQPSPVIDAAIPSATAPSGRVLDYAPPPPLKQSAIRKRPWLASIGAFLEAMGHLSIALAPAILAWSMTGILRQYALAAMLVGAVTLALVCGMVRRALRQTDGIPAAARWPRRKLLVYSICGLFACGLTLVALDMGTKRRMLRVRDEMDAQSQSLYIPVPSGTPNAADTYRQAFALMAQAAPALPDWSARYSPTSNAPTAPPALSPEFEAAVPLLREASLLPVADWGIVPKSYNVTVLLPHLAQLRRAARLLNMHAASEALAGRADSAIHDIHALRAMARHAGQGQALVEGLVAIGIDAVADESTEDVLPLVTDERLLGQLQVPPNTWHRELRVRMFRGEQASSVRMMADIYDGKMTALTPGAATLAATPLNWARVFLADTEIGGMRRLFDEIAVIAGHEPDQVIREIRQFDAQFPARRAELGLLAPILVPSVSRAAAKTVEVGLLSQLNNVGVAARRLYLRTGRFPASLDELVSAGLLQKVPTDPFSGKPVLMKVKESEIVIYSVGPDGRDDGGDTFLGKDITFRVGIKPLWEIDMAEVKSDADSAGHGD